MQAPTRVGNVVLAAANLALAFGRKVRNDDGVIASTRGRLRSEKMVAARAFRRWPSRLVQLHQAGLELLRNLEVEEAALQIIDRQLGVAVTPLTREGVRSNMVLLQLLPIEYPDRNAQVPPRSGYAALRACAAARYLCPCQCELDGIRSLRKCTRGAVKVRGKKKLGGLSQVSS